MTVVTALFMIPTALVFPALLRQANTPPHSVTLARERYFRRQAAWGRSSLDGREHSKKNVNRQLNKRDEENNETGPDRKYGTHIHAFRAASPWPCFARPVYR